MTTEELLTFVNHNGEVTCRDVADSFEIDLRHACAYLHKAWRVGYLMRRRERSVFVYSLSARGHKKLRWYWSRQDEEEET